MVQSSNTQVASKAKTRKSKGESVTKTCSKNWKALQDELKKESSKVKETKKANLTWKKNLTKTKKPVKKTYSMNKHKKQAAKTKDTNNEKPEIWFDDVDPADILAAEQNTKTPVNISSLPKVDKAALTLEKKHAFSGITKAVAMDCEMVGVGDDGQESVLARVSLVNQFGKCLYDKFVKAREEVTDYRTSVSGVRPTDLANAEEFTVVQKEVCDIIDGRILVGHALWNDMKVLFLDHPKKWTRDTSKYKPFQEVAGTKLPALRVLCSKILGIQVQKGEHSSVQDAQAAMRLYTMHKREWEKDKPKLKKTKKRKRNPDANKSQSRTA